MPAGAGASPAHVDLREPLLELRELLPKRGDSGGRGSLVRRARRAEGGSAARGARRGALEAQAMNGLGRRSDERAGRGWVALRQSEVVGDGSRRSALILVGAGPLAGAGR